MAKTVEAVFEDGVFKPISPITLSEHKRVTLIINNNKEETPYILSVASIIVTNGCMPKFLQCAFCPVGTD